MLLRTFKDCVILGLRFMRPLESIARAAVLSVSVTQLAAGCVEPNQEAGCQAAYSRA